MAFKTLIYFITLSLLVLVAVHARLHLDGTDHNALLTVLHDFGITGQRHGPDDLCSSAGVFCEPRISNNTYVHRATRIVFKSQRLKGVLSTAIGQLSELRELTLSNNRLNGHVPIQIVECRELEILNLRNNRFSGQVPSELSSLVRLRILDLSMNKFSGNLNFLKHFPNLEKLFLADNMFTGKVPPSLRSFRNLHYFNVSGNGLLEVPGLLEKNQLFQKRYIFAETNLTVRNHSISIAPSVSVDSFGAPAPSPVEAPHKHKKKKKTKGLVLGFLAGIVAGCISGVIFSILVKLMLDFIKGREGESGPAIFSQHIKKDQLAFLEKDDGLANLELIGRGGCGEVYKTELEGSKIKTIAIKRVVQPPKDAAELTEEDSKLMSKKMRQIKSEIQTVGQIRHRNVLPLLAHVSRPDCHYLVYEFMKNGSLQDILNQVSHGNRELDWLTRHKIAVGVAAGLEYLHMGHSKRIIHRDLKPANVLLDDNMEARIADFGLAKSIPDADTHMSSSHVAGTLGYIAPEYHQTMKFTDKCDIYSFGVLLGVLVIGKLPSDEFFQHTSEINLVKWMRNVMTSDDPKQAIDPKLLGNGYEEQMLLVLKIAFFCTLDDPKQRPNSKDVSCMLDQIKHREFHASSTDVQRIMILEQENMISGAKI